MKSKIKVQKPAELKKEKDLSTEEMLAELKNVPPEQLLAALKEYLLFEHVDKKKLH